MAIVIDISLLAFAYLLGSIPFGLLLAKAYKLGDVRKIGSGNIGATNVLRTGNKKIAAATLLLDASKGVAAVVIAKSFASYYVFPFAALLVVLGHIFPVWLNFKGGKGVATGFGVLIAYSFPLFIFSALTWVLVFTAFRISSLSAIIAFVFTPVAVFYFFDFMEFLPLLVMCGVILYRHKDNLIRIANGEEAAFKGK